MKRFVFLIVFSLFVLGNFYVFFRVYPILDLLSPSLHFIYWLVVVLVCSSIFLFFGIGRKLPVYLSAYLYKIGTGWLMLLIYAFLFVLILDVVSVVNHFFVHSENRILIYHSDLQSCLLVFGVVAIALLGFINYQRKRRVEIDLSFSTKTRYKIIFVSDLHLGYAIEKRELKKWVALINQEQADLVLIGGDLIDYSLQPVIYNELGSLLQKIETKYGVYACLGNHEYMAGAKACVSFMQSNGIRVLSDQTIVIEDLSLCLIGRDDKTNPRRKKLADIIGDIDRNLTCVLLDHQPYNLSEANENGIDLQLSGHTHRGQVWPISWITDRLFENAHGYLKKGKTHYYVSSGLGIWGGRYRIGTQSEYVVINVK
ncbi:metallophosphoesterase [Myroides albus]|uniref:Metallophosphoesterase n=1 Tax=Myroides albus TaxID=2562892 RepID=A0A6I3LL17_9FLAO|nr:metallophosphoesterase [Myroides albus]MTG97970.1 metallophosphoesterase [Myroides albus]UVD80261.1 metallophosphoesterase [Myroides albus]